MYRIIEKIARKAAGKRDRMYPATARWFLIFILVVVLIGLYLLIFHFWDLMIDSQDWEL